MATKKYLSLDRLTEYDALLKAKITADDTTTLDSAKGYTDDEITKIKDGTYTALNAKCDFQGQIIHETYATQTNLDNHNIATDAHQDIRNSVNTLSQQVNNFLDVDDTTKDQLSEVLALIEDNKESFDELTSNKVNKTDIVDNLTTADATKVLSANQGVVINTRLDAMAEETLGNIKIVSMNSNKIDDMDDDGIYWSGNGSFEDDAERVICTYSTRSQLPIIAGNNVTFEYANENKVIEINANIEEITSAEIQALFNATT